MTMRFSKVDVRRRSEMKKKSRTTFIAMNMYLPRVSWFRDKIWLID